MASKIRKDIQKIPEMQQKKLIIEKHQNINMYLLKEIKKRKLDIFFEIE